MPMSPLRRPRSPRRAVRVSTAGANVLLRPGQEASETNGKLIVTAADTARATRLAAWDLQLHHASVPELMRQLARWYNVGVEYKGVLPADATFTGDMGRNLSLAQVPARAKRDEPALQYRRG